jgi:penicillin amidase
MGYAHATDRPTQLLLMRILGKGRGSEHLVADETMLEIDKFFRKMNWKSGLDQELQKFSQEELTLAQAYCAGVNAVILKKRPLHFKLMGYKPEPWTVEDSILISRMTGYISLAQSQGEVERFFLQLVQNDLPEEKLNDLFPGIIHDADLDLIKKIKFEEKLVPDGVKWMNMISAAIASNNWIVNGKRTTSGHPILANDPHLETNRLPNVWYEVHLKLKDRFFKGCTMPGLPACLIGRTNDLAWGATYTFMDAIDSWVEDIKDKTYLKDGSRQPLRKRTEIIKRKKKEDYAFDIYETEHGTLDGTPDQDGYYLATKWASSASGHRSVKTIRNVVFAKTVEEGMALIGDLEVSFNWVLADTTGNIGYQMSGMMPKRKEGWLGFTPGLGWDSSYDWQGFVEAKDLPRSLNPDKGYFITCNQDLNEYGNVDPINIAMGDYRFRRVETLIKDQDKHTTSDFQRFQNDLYSIQAEELLPYFIPHLQGEQLELLEKWDFNYHPDQKAPMFFEELYKGLIQELLTDNLGPEVAAHLLNETGILADFYLNFDEIIHNAKSHWFSTTSREDMIKRVIQKQASVVVRRWGDVNRFTMTNMFFGGKLPKFLGFDKGPVELKGGRATVHQGQIYSAAGRETSFTPSYRFVTDLSEQFIYSSLAGGASDKRWSKYYANEIENWTKGIYKKL